MLVYLADLIHDYFPGLNAVPLNIGCIGAYAKKLYLSDVEIKLFKSCGRLLKAIEERKPDIVGFSNYTWNEELNSFAGNHIKSNYHSLPIIMGGPNIRINRSGIKSFLASNDYVDMYITFAGEQTFSWILEKALERPKQWLTAENIRQLKNANCFTLQCGQLQGHFLPEQKGNLDEIPSPYTTGLLDEFLNPEFFPIFETNRGCPYSCIYCTWGAATGKRIKIFSLERVFSEMKYVAKRKIFSFQWMLGDANFGIFARDVEIARYIRNIYEQYHPFHDLNICWAKNPKNNMIEIANILKGICNASIAFQTFDPEVAHLIKRKNIPIDWFFKIAPFMLANSTRFQTDILLGLPGETINSHLFSLRKAVELGFDYIAGGEIRLLKGSELETEEARQKNGIKTKYRLLQEGFGVYNGKFVAEFEESIRSTKWISEEEMLWLRVFRAIFYAAVTIGEFDPLLKYLKRMSVNAVDLFSKVLVNKSKFPIVANSIKWLLEKAKNEWFSTKEDALKFYSQLENQKKLLENPVVKLNYDFFSYLILSEERYLAFYECISKTIQQDFAGISQTISTDLLKLCRARNYIVQCLMGRKDIENKIEVSSETIEELIKISYLPRQGKKFNVIHLTMDKLVGSSIEEALRGPRPMIQTVSILLSKYSIYFEPALDV